MTPTEEIARAIVLLTTVFSAPGSFHEGLGRRSGNSPQAVTPVALTAECRPSPPFASPRCPSGARGLPSSLSAGTV